MELITVAYEERLIMELDGKKVSLTVFPFKEPGCFNFGIDAPRDITIHREEIYKKIKSH